MDLQMSLSIPMNPALHAANVRSQIVTAKYACPNRNQGLKARTVTAQGKRPGTQLANENKP